MRKNSMTIIPLAVLILTVCSIFAGTNRWVSDGYGRVIKPDGSDIADVVVSPPPRGMGRIYDITKSQ